MSLSQTFVLSTFYQHCKRPIHKKSTGTYNAECPYCHEGKSAGKKRRFFYIPGDSVFYCHNCNKTKSGIDFVKDMTGMTYLQVMEQADNHTQTIEDIIKKTAVYKKFNPNPLPDDSINLLDPNQLSFYKENKVVKDTLEFINKRRINTAINRPKSLWVSLVDFTHKNRLVFPFYDMENKINFYQTRGIYPEDIEFAKYLSKANSDKGIFNLNKVSSDVDYIFLQEGPIDAMFLQNSVALAGVHATEEQLETLQTAYPFHELIYVLDNQWRDKTSLKMTAQLIEQGYKVFIWPEELLKYKDINDICVALSKDSFDWKYVIQHTYQGMNAALQLSQVKLT